MVLSRMFCLLVHAHRGVSVGLHLRNELLGHRVCTPATSVDDTELSREAVVGVYTQQHRSDRVALCPTPNVSYCEIFKFFFALLVYEIVSLDEQKHLMQLNLFSERFEPFECSLGRCYLKCVIRLGVSVSLGSLLDVQILRPHPETAIAETQKYWVGRGQAAICTFTSLPAGDSDVLRSGVLVLESLLH